jgi:O-antigen ligase
VALNTHWINWGRLPGRISGWWDPVVGGSLLTSFLGIALAIAAAATTNVRRAAAGFVVLAALAGIIVTGTRGAWIGGILTLGVGVLVIVWCRAFTRAGGQATPRRRAAIAGALALTCAGIVGASALAVWTVPSLRARLDDGRREVRRTLHQADYTTFTGARLAMWEWALAAWRCHPIVGVGAGGYQAWVREQTTLALAQESRELAGSGGVEVPSIMRPCLPREKLGPIVVEPNTTSDYRRGWGRPLFARELVHAHAHGVWPHVAATTGTVGLALLVWLLLVPMLRPAVRLFARPFMQAPRAGEPHSTAPAAADPIPLVCALGLVGLLAAGLFDSISVNQQTWYLASVLLALGVTGRPSSAAEGPAMYSKRNDPGDPSLSLQERCHGEAVTERAASFVLAAWIGRRAAITSLSSLGGARRHLSQRERVGLIRKAQMATHTGGAA